MSVEAVKFLLSRGADPRDICHRGCDVARTFMTSLDFLPCPNDTTELLNIGKGGPFCQHWPLAPGKTVFSHWKEPLSDSVSHGATQHQGERVVNLNLNLKNATSKTASFGDSWHSLADSWSFHKLFSKHSGNYDQELLRHFKRMLFDPSVIRQSAELENQDSPSHNFPDQDGVWVALSIEKYGSPMSDYSAPKVKSFLMPLPFMSGFKFLNAVVKASLRTRDSAIFRNQVVAAAVRHAWESGGRRYFLILMSVEACYLSLLSTSVYTFDDKGSLLHGNRSILIALIVLDAIQMIRIVILLKRRLQLFPIHDWKKAREDQWYSSAYVDMYLVMDVVSAVLVLAGMSIRLSSGIETDESAACLCVGVVAVWLRSLYYLRPFEPTAPLVKMIFYTLSEIKYFFIVLFMVLIGFSQGLFLISYDKDEGDFHSSSNSLLSAFAYMMGQGNYSNPQNTSNSSLASFMQVMLVLVTTILLLNLLIALVNSGYTDVKKNFKEEHLLEQARTMLDQLVKVGRPERFLVCLRREDDASKEQADYEKILKELREIMRQQFQEMKDNILNYQSDIR